VSWAEYAFFAGPIPVNRTKKEHIDHATECQGCLQQRPVAEIIANTLWMASMIFIDGKCA